MARQCPVFEKNGNGCHVTVIVKDYTTMSDARQPNFSACAKNPFSALAEQAKTGFFVLCQEWFFLFIEHRYAFVVRPELEEMGRTFKPVGKQYPIQVVNFVL